MKKSMIGIALALALLVALCAFHVSAAEADFSQPVTCQHCNKEVTWLPLNADVAAAWAGNFDPANGTHYYLSEEKLSLSKSITVAKGESLCLHLNGKTYFREEARAFNISGSFAFMDHPANEGKILGHANNSSTGCVIRLGTAGATVDQYGGTVQMLPGSAAKHVLAGNGGSVYMVANTSYTLHDGVIADGASAAGGNVYIADQSVFTMNGGIIQNGATMNKAVASNITVTNQYGGNVYVATGGTFTMNAGTITGGSSSASGGNIGGYGTVNLNGGIVTAGAADTSGGNVFMGSKCVVNLNGATLSNGEAGDRGGNLYMAATNCVFTMTSGTVTGGKSTNNGGNLLLNNGQATISGGTVTGGSAGGNGGNISVNAGANSENNWLKLSGGTVTGGTAAKNGDNIYVTGTLVLSAAPAVESGNIYIDTNGKLQVAATYAGQANVRFADAHLPKYIPGGALTETLDSCEGAFTGKLYVENVETLPYLYGKQGDTKLYVTAAARVAADGTHTWYTDNATMMAALDGTEAHIRAAAGTLNLTGDALVDLGGQNVTVTGTGNVTFFDSANTDYSTYGTATVSGITVKNEPKTQVAGLQYYTVQEGDTYSFHLLKVELTNVNIRPSSAGIYYDGVWGCDEKLAEAMVASFGIAVSLDRMPTETFDTDSSVLTCAYTAAQMETGETKSGVVVTDILQAGESEATNDTNGRKPVYARAYVKLNDGTVTMSDMGAAESLYSVMTRLDKLIDEDIYTYRRYQKSGRSFYETWQDKGMATWGMKNLLPTADDGIIDLLMIGNSFSHYYVQELEAISREAGMPIRVCNVYAGGCSLSQHYNWWKDNESNYSFYVTENGVRTGTSDVGLEWCLAQGDWDVISLQQVSSAMLNKSAEDHLVETADIRKALYDYLKTQFPDADIYWHQVWSYELGHARTGFTMDTTEKQQLIADRNRTFALGVCAENGVKRVNTGEAWQYFRNEYVGNDGFTDTLCARLDSNSGKGDGYHDGDTGGGQYLNACVWFEILTGKDCRETTYRPSYTYKSQTYTLDETLISALQDCAHKAVSDLRAWEAQQ